MLAKTIQNPLVAGTRLGGTAQLNPIVTTEDLEHYAAASGDFSRHQGMPPK